MDASPYTKPRNLNQLKDTLVLVYRIVAREDDDSGMSLSAAREKRIFACSHNDSFSQRTERVRDSSEVLSLGYLIIILKQNPLDFRAAG
jgi:hypothetical protein